jgi:hypothetical protein
MAKETTSVLFICFFFFHVLMVIQPFRVEETVLQETYCTHFLLSSQYPPHPAFDASSLPLSMSFISVSVAGIQNIQLTYCVLCLQILYTRLEVGGGGGPTRRQQNKCGSLENSLLIYSLYLLVFLFNIFSPLA